MQQSAYYLCVYAAVTVKDIECNCKIKFCQKCAKCTQYAYTEWIISISITQFLVSKLSYLFSISNYCSGPIHNNYLKLTLMNLVPA